MFLQSHIPTALAALVVTCAMLAVSLGYAARGARDGLGTWALGLCCVASAFLLLTLRGAAPDRVLLSVGNVVLSVGVSLFLIAADRFHGHPPRRAAALSPPMALAAALPFAADPLHRILLANLVFTLQFAWPCVRLLRASYDFPLRGRNLTVVGLAALVTVTGSRAWTAMFDPAGLREFLQPSAVQSLTYFVALGGIVLASNGFAMMAKERSDERLRLTAMRDRLTQCWNRVRIEEAATQEIARLRRYGHPVSAFIADIDHFKTINDRHGHGAGDDVLKAFVEVVQRTIRGTDVLGRWGGEEFIAILPMSGIAEAAAIAERVRANVEAHVFPHGLRITVSLGLAACLTTDGWEEWLRRADTALYRAKSGGRNRVVTEGLEIVRRSSPIGSVAVPQLIWRTGYLCGEDTIDRQHRDLFEKANALLALSGEPAAKAEIVAALRAFLDDTEAHFADEERIVEDAGYEDALDHARIHRALLARSEDLLQRYADDEIGAEALLHFVIHELFANHILAEDQTFGHLFRA